MVSLLVGDPVEEASFTAASVGHADGVLEERAGSVGAGGGNADNSLATSTTASNGMRSPQCLCTDVSVRILPFPVGTDLGEL